MRNRWIACADSSPFGYRWRQESVAWRWSYGEQLQAAPTHADLTFSMEFRRADFFLEQRREHQQRKRRRPRKRHRFIGGPSEVRIQPRFLVFIEGLPKQPHLEQFKGVFLGGPERHHWSRSQFESCVGSESRRYPSWIGIHYWFFLFFCSRSGRGLFVFVYPNKKPAIDVQSRVLSGNWFKLLEFHTRDAKNGGAAMPDGHLSIDLLALFGCKRGCHC
jgi:hypothetical protein